MPRCNMEDLATTTGLAAKIVLIVNSHNVSLTNAFAHSVSSLLHKKHYILVEKQRMQQRCNMEDLAPTTALATTIVLTSPVIAAVVVAGTVHHVAFFDSKPAED
ncbi:unnamed protein product [Microthlaspi erraticum]|uniref:Uncharacterized protein n=1 Tax=Microthlaspi erraticum TaxID=1685480 RepID=A0A6D2IE35_9BRAS|nr:unnamed protein product [Microthlaspi erraticum]